MEPDGPTPYTTSPGEKEMKTTSRLSLASGIDFITKFFRKLKELRRRRALRRAAWKATGNDAYLKQYPLFSGYRVIKEFEKINGLAFDPFNHIHVFKISWAGRYFLAARNAKITCLGVKNE